MNNTKSHHFNMRNKLMATVAMLLVASIMMVSTTYAWFTLSTAPEVQGITTTVGANGNLEIALAPYSGLGTDVAESAVGTSDLDWDEKNLTWGNLLDLSDESYGLDEITLLPAQLTAAASGTGYAFTESPLATPVYGVDGRITSLTSNTIIGGRQQTTTTTEQDGKTVTTTTLSEGFSAKGVNGIRAVGTASNMTERQLGFAKSLSAIKSNSALANKAASTSLNNRGSALANIMVLHAKAGDNDGNNYVDYVADLQLLTQDLSTSSTYIGESLRAAMLAAAAMALTDETAYNAAKKTIEETTDLKVLFAEDGTYATYWSSVDWFKAAVEEWKAIEARVGTAQSEAAALATTGTVSWNDISGVLGELMNTNGTITISGYTIDAIKEKMDDYNFLLGLAKDCKIVLGEDSGVYYDISQMTGTITSAMTAQVPFEDSHVDLDASIVTPAPANGGSLNEVYAKTSAAGTFVEWGAGDAMIDVFYGYVVDFMFRTNVSGSKLKLQTEGAQRIYSDGTNEQTMGDGSTITFTLSDALNANTVKGLVEAVNVVFFDPSTSEIYGVAKVTGTSIDDTSVVGELELWSYTVTDKGYVVLDATNQRIGDTAAEICGLDQNVAKAVSVLVFLDGNNVTNADVLNNENITGTLNLQFSSSATLVPMDNAALKNGAASNAGSGTDGQ